MLKKKLIWLVTITFLAALILSSTAFADSEVPQVPAVDEPTAQPADPAAAAVEAAPATAAATPAIELRAVTEAATVVVETPAVEATTEPAVEAAPEEQPSAEAPVLVDASGESLVLASQASADLINSGDPYWFVGSQKYATVKVTGTCPIGTTEGSTCWVNAGSSITEALNRIESGLLPTDRKIYVLYDTYSENITINGSLPGDAIKRQLNGIIGNPNGAGIPTINGDVTLSYLTGGFTLSGFTINGGVSLKNSSGTVMLQDVKVSNHSGKGISIGTYDDPHVGSVTLQNVDSSNNTQIGAEIYGYLGNLKITNSSFDYNDDGTPENVGGDEVYGGLTVGYEVGTITLDGVTASNNNGDGVYVFYHYRPLIIKNSLFCDNSYGTGLYVDGWDSASETLDTVIANGNHDYGIYLWTDGAVTLNNVEASDTVFGTGLTVENSDTTLPIKVSNGIFNSNGLTSSGYGLTINVLGSVTLTSITANENSSGGAYVNNCRMSSGNCQGSGSVTVTSPALAGDHGANNFSGNHGGYGLQIASKGNVTISNLDASGNSNGAVMVENIWGTGGITINKTLPLWVNSFENNGGDALYFWTKGSIIVNDSRILKNSGRGIYTYSDAKSISISRSRFDENTQAGMFLNSIGTVTLVDTGASGNGNIGVSINNTYGTGNVTVKSSKYGVTYEYSDNTNSGLRIESKGVITASDIVADGNGQVGLNINNNVASPSAPKAVSVARSRFNGNGSDGLRVDTLGSVTLDTLTASGNDLTGAYIYACTSDGIGGCTTSAAVTLKGADSNFSGNLVNGLVINTKGNVSLTNLTADNNHGCGINISNSYVGGGNVAISASGTFVNSTSGNGTATDDSGLAISSKGTITLSKLASSFNKGYGAALYNNNAPSPKTVTLSNCDFDFNQGNYGVYIRSIGNVTLNSTSADSNEQFGMDIETDGSVVLNGVTASHNSLHESRLYTDNVTVTERLTSDVEGDKWWFTGNAAITYLIKLESGDFDAYLKLYSADGTLISEDDSSFGGGSGIDDAQISLGPGALETGEQYYLLLTTADGWGESGGYTLYFNNNSAQIGMGAYYGAKIVNTNGSAGVTVTSPGTTWSEFSDNNGKGLEITTNGAASITNASASHNGTEGIYIYANGSVAIKNTSTTHGSFFNGNNSDGLYVGNANGLTLSGRIWLQDNNGSGANLYSTIKPVTISGIYASGNTEYGLVISSMGNVTMSNITSRENGDSGIYISNGGGVGNVTISGINYLGYNGTHGLGVESQGNISITGITAENNDDDGINIYTYGSGKTVLLKNITSQLNLKNGLYVESHGAVTFNSVKSLLNGVGNNSNGIDVLTQGGNVLLQTCNLIGNEGSGLLIDTGGTGILTITGSNYFGNDTDKSGDLNIEWVP